MNKKLTENEESKEVIIARLLELIEINSTMLQNHLNQHSPNSITKQYKDLIKRYSYELAEVTGFEMKGNKLSHIERVELFFVERRKIEEVQKQLRIQEEKKRRDRELGKDNVILMLDIHRDFAKECLFGCFETTTNKGFECIESEKYREIKGSELIDFTFFSRVMVTDEVIYSYCEDTRVQNFVNNLIERNEYYLYSVKNLEWNISMIDIEILFNVLRENQFIEPETSRNTFFQIFNPHLSVFSEPIEWRDIKELVYFLDKCKEYSLFENSKYQNIVERYRMFKTNFSKGDYIKSNSLRTTLSDVKNEFGNYSENQIFLQRAKLIDEFLDNVTV